MAENGDGRGRPKAPGFVIYLGRVRVVPGLDPPELVEFARLWQEADSDRKSELLRAALVGGLSQAQVQADQVEDAETTDLLDDLLADF